ncbi:MAG TPA: hypothetical protein VMZ27_11740, partial [Candidatus Saccharimonadales bacterium]|nr:hypothetical protein [Candidatus Saccharimonadales bacterium]
MKLDLPKKMITSRFVAAMLFGACVSRLAGAEPAPAKRAALEIADVKRSDTVDFEKEILPILRNNCLAC